MKSTMSAGVIPIMVDPVSYQIYAVLGLERNYHGAKRSYHWSDFGGRSNPRESELDTAKRESFEESQGMIRVSDQLDKNNYLIKLTFRLAPKFVKHYYVIEVAYDASLPQRFKEQSYRVSTLRSLSRTASSLSTTISRIHENFPYVESVYKSTNGRYMRVRSLELCGLVLHVNCTTLVGSVPVQESMRIGSESRALITRYINVVRSIKHLCGKTTAASVGTRGCAEINHAFTEKEEIRLVPLCDISTANVQARTKRAILAFVNSIAAVSGHSRDVLLGKVYRKRHAKSDASKRRKQELVGATNPARRCVDALAHKSQP